MSEPKPKPKPKPKRVRRPVVRDAKASRQGFGARLAQLRAAAALTQRELAARLGVTRRQIAYYESGASRPPGALLGLLADLFQVSTDVLLGRVVTRGAAGRLSRMALTHLHQIERMGADACRRLEAALEQFVIAEDGRRKRPARSSPAGAAPRGPRG